MKIHAKTLSKIAQQLQEVRNQYPDKMVWQIHVPKDRQFVASLDSSLPTNSFLYQTLTFTALDRYTWHSNELDLTVEVD